MSDEIPKTAIQYNAEQRVMTMDYREYQNLISATSRFNDDNVKILLTELLGYFTIMSERNGKDSFEEKMCQRIEKVLKP